MSYISNRIGLLLAIGALAAAQSVSFAEPEEFASTLATRSASGPLLWQEPRDIQSRNLYLGSGGTADMPKGPFTFVEEDMGGTNPKFVIKDARGIKWKAKLGAEARPETVASRFVWAVGYYVPVEYFVRSLPVQQRPRHLQRGGKWVHSSGPFENVRLKMDDKSDKKLSAWKWRHNELSPRELNGLRVMMALMNNWDLKDENNAIYSGEGGTRYMVSDLGATFGGPRLGLNHDKSRDNLQAYAKSKFITKTTSEYVDFGVPATPALLSIFALPEFIHRVGLRRIGKRVPLEDARWMGSILSRLTPAQIHDAFRAGGYSPEECNAFGRVMEQRIAALSRL